METVPKQTLEQTLVKLSSHQHRTWTLNDDDDDDNCDCADNNDNDCGKLAELEMVSSILKKYELVAGAKINANKLLGL